MITTTSRSFLLLLAVAACGDPPVDVGTSGDSSSTGAPADESSSTGSPDAESSGASTSTGETSTGAGDACFGDSCTGTCGPGMLCAPHPDNASLAVCAAPCFLDGPPCALDVDGCGEAPLGECRVGFSGTVLCFPVLCDGSAACASGECVDGRCA